MTEQRAWVYRSGIGIGVTTISSGKPGHDTPTGVFVIDAPIRAEHSHPDYTVLSNRAPEHPAN